MNESNQTLIAVAGIIICAMMITLLLGFLLRDLWLKHSKWVVRVGDVWLKHEHEEPEIIAVERIGIVADDLANTGFGFEGTLVKTDKSFGLGPVQLSYICSRSWFDKERKHHGYWLRIAQHDNPADAVRYALDYASRY